MDADLRRRLRAAAKRRQAAQAEWEAVIREARATGTSFRDIGREAGVSHAAIKKIVDRSPHDR